jgi:predicted nucleic-acid-binding protein
MVSLLTLLEMEWVLRSRYASSKEDIAATISSLLDAAKLTFEDEPSIEEAIHLWKGSSTDFADCLINAHLSLRCVRKLFLPTHSAFSTQGEAIKRLRQIIRGIAHSS